MQQTPKEPAKQQRKRSKAASQDHAALITDSHAVRSTLVLQCLSLSVPVAELHLLQVSSFLAEAPVGQWDGPASQPSSRQASCYLQCCRA